MKSWYCSSCTWEGKSPDTVAVMFHYCRDDAYTRQLLAWLRGVDETPEERRHAEREAWAARFGEGDQ